MKKKKYNKKMFLGKECNGDSDFTLENIISHLHGLIEIKLKLHIRDSACLSMVYSPGVAQPCLEIEKDITRAYEFTNKGNSIILVTDSSCVTEKPWHENASMPYLEIFSAYYKQVANIDAYPIILDIGRITNSEVLCETVCAISPCYSGVEFFNVSEQRRKEFLELWKKSSFYNQFAYLDGCCKRDIDNCLKGKKTDITSLSIYAAIWRVLLDIHFTGDANPILKYILELIKSGSLNLNRDKSFNADFFEILEKVVDHVFGNGLVKHDLDKYNWHGMETTKDYIYEKFKCFLTYGSKGWREPMPKGYYMHKHTNPENSNLIHMRNRGVIEIGLKIKLGNAKQLKSLYSWENLDALAKKIAAKPELGNEITCKSNYGGIITNGTAILGLGNIGALAGMPVMEGKSVLFKYFGGTDICPICIQEQNQDKLISLIQNIAPSFCAINLEDIKGPDCFFIETKLIETVSCPMFHDDQHGTAIVTLAGMINAMKLRKTKLEDCKIVMNGAGAAGLAVCTLLMNYGFKHFIVCDTHGAIYKGRPHNMNPFKDRIAEVTNKECIKGTLSDVIKGADVVIGLSGPKTISKENVQSMAKNPVVFALANPEPEIFPELAKEAGAYIIATGRSDYPNQINNSVCFPGLFRGTIDTKAPKITTEMKIAAAEAIAGLVSEEQLRPEFIMPSALDIKNSVRVAVDVAKVVIEKGLTKKTNINLDKLQENINSYFIDMELHDVDN